MNPTQLVMFQDVKSRIEQKGGTLLSTAYVESKASLNVMCERGHTWTPSRDSIVSGRWCSVCKGNNNDAKKAEFRAYVASKEGRVIVDYVNMDAEVTVECSQQHRWSVRASWLMRDHWCRKCSDREEQSREEFYAVVANKGGTATGTYENTRSIMHLVCEQGHEWDAAVQDIKKGTWCAECTLGTDRARQELSELVKEKGGRVEGVYQNNRSRMHFFCAKGHEWTACPFSIKTGTWCPKYSRSRGEEKVEEVLKALGIDYQTQYRHALIPHRKYDFFFVYQGVSYIIEFDGGQHFAFESFFHRSEEDFLQKQEVDRIKTYIPMLVGRRMIRIDHTQMDEVEFHVKTAIAQRSKLYLSTPDMYSWLVQRPIDWDVLCHETRGELNNAGRKPFCIARLL